MQSGGDGPRCAGLARQAPAWQWVLSFEIRLGVLFAAHPELLTPVMRIIHRVIAGFLVKQAGLRRATADAGAGGIVQYQKEKRFWPEWRDYVETKFAVLRSSVLGFVIGVIPGAGATIASLMSYSIEKAVSKTPEKFGKGMMAGLVGPEAANNAASSGAVVPLLALGLPGSASTAVLLAAFLMWGLTPGPLLMTQKPEFAWGLIASMYLGNVALLALNIFAIPLFVQMIKVPYRVLAPAVILVCTIGTYSVNGSMIETWLMFAAGLVGFFMKLHGYSPAALVPALVLGPLAEQSLRQTLTISRGSFAIFLDRPASLWILAFTVVILVIGLMLHRRRLEED